MRRLFSCNEISEEAEKNNKNRIDIVLCVLKHTECVRIRNQSETKEEQKTLKIETFVGLMCECVWVNSTYICLRIPLQLTGFKRRAETSCYKCVGYCYCWHLIQTCMFYISLKPLAHCWNFHIGIQQHICILLSLFLFLSSSFSLFLGLLVSAMYWSRVEWFRIWYVWDCLLFCFCAFPSELIVRTMFQLEMDTEPMLLHLSIVEAVFFISCSFHFFFDFVVFDSK